MIDLVIKRMPRSFPFHAFNASVALTIVFLLARRSCRILPTAAKASPIDGRAGACSEHQEDRENADGKSAHAGDPFLAGSEERVVSADLQANLKAIASKSGVRFLGIRGLPAVRSQQLRMVVVSLDIEGLLRSVESVIRSIEGQTPYLFVTSAVLRRATDAEEVIRELKVQGAIRIEDKRCNAPSDASHSAEQDGE
jgi:hypothetical protein